jgi:predicted extracellular nuclease
MYKTSFKVFSVLMVLALVLMALPMQKAQALSTDVVISQVYGGGGNSGGIYTNDFVELFNRGTSTVSLTGWSIQYTSATGTGLFGSSTTLITPLSGSLAPSQYLLIQEAAGANVIAPLPTPDITDSTPINMSGTGGKVALVMSTDGLGCNGGSTLCSAAQLALIKDLVGWDGANFYETAAAPATTNPTAVLRLAYGCTETDNNASDFAASAPTPRNTASPLNPCAAPEAAPEVAGTYPVNGATDFPINANLSVTFSEPVNVSASCKWCEHYHRLQRRTHYLHARSGHTASQWRKLYVDRAG